MLAIVVPTLGASVASSLLVGSVVRAERLADLDAALAGRAAAVANMVEFDGGWEVEDPPEHVVAPLDGYEVSADGRVLTHAGALVDRTWAGRFEVETEGAPARSVDVRVSQDATPVYEALNLLLLELAGLAAVICGAAAAAAHVLSTRIVSGAEFRRLEDAWARQAAFTADAAHELRTPLAVVRTQAEVALRNDRTVEVYRAALAHVLAASVRMQDVLEGLLVLARGDERLDGAPCDLVEVVRGACGRAAPRAGVALLVDAPARADARGDARLLGLLVDNLVANALRHTASGVVRVGVVAEPAAWRIDVEDTGEGIAPEHLGRVFERFYRVDPARSRAEGGAGLGLSIVRAVATRHGGSVELRSTPGAGTTVSVRLPTDA